MLKVMIIHASTREGRQGLPVSEWVVEGSRKVDGMEINFVDLKELNLPFFNEAHHPRLQKYTHEATKEWSARVEQMDAFILVTCEYNYGMPATLKNALDFLSLEWKYKPVTFVGYGGISGGTRSIQQLKQVTSALRMFPFEGIQIPFFGTQINEEGLFVPNDHQTRALSAMFTELQHLGEGMKALW